MKKLSICFLFSLALALVVPTAKAAASPPPFGGSLLLFTNAVAASENVTNTAAKRPIDIPANQVLCVGMTVLGAGGGSNTYPVTCGFNGSIDGISWTKQFPWSANFATWDQNTNYVIAIVGTNIPVRFLSLDKIVTSSTNAITISNAVYFFTPTQ